MKTLIIGPLPPPLGGVSVYVSRLRRKLTAEGHTVDTVDVGHPDRFGRFIHLLSLQPSSYDVIELNVLSTGILSALLARNLAGKCRLTIHSGQDLENWGPVKSAVVELFLRRCGELVFVGPHLRELFDKQGFSLPDTTTIHPAFLPPSLEDETTIRQSYSNDVRDFIEQRRPLIVANAFRLVFHEGIDLYGLDMCVELIARLQIEFPNVGLLFALAEIGERGHYRKIREMIAKRKLGNNICFMTGQKELWPIFRQADLLVRPTCVDGYGISIAEALYFGCPAVASDVCVRPEGTVVFARGNMDDFQHKCEDILSRGKIAHNLR